MHGEGPRQRVRQGHGKGGGWKIGHDRGECAGRRPGLWTPRKEEQVELKSEDMSRAEVRAAQAEGQRGERDRAQGGQEQTKRMVYG